MSSLISYAACCGTLMSQLHSSPRNESQSPGTHHHAEQRLGRPRGEPPTLSLHRTGARRAVAEVAAAPHVG
jgi:hypothetical protein